MPYVLYGDKMRSDPRKRQADHDLDCAKPEFPTECITCNPDEPFYSTRVLYVTRRTAIPLSGRDVHVGVACTVQAFRARRRSICTL